MMAINSSLVLDRLKWPEICMICCRLPVFERIKRLFKQNLANFHTRNGMVSQKFLKD